MDQVHHVCGDYLPLEMVTVLILLNLISISPAVLQSFQVESEEIISKSFLFQYNMLRWLLTRPERKCKILGKSGGDCFVMPLHVRGDNNAVSVFVLIEFDRLKNNVQLSALSCRFMWEETGTGRHFSNTLNNLTFRLSMFNFQLCHDKILYLSNSIKTKQILRRQCRFMGTGRHFSNTLNNLTSRLVSTFN